MYLLYFFVMTTDVFAFVANASHGKPLRLGRSTSTKLSFSDVSQLFSLTISPCPSRFELPVLCSQTAGLGCVEHLLQDVIDWPSVSLKAQNMISYWQIFPYYSHQKLAL